jgi:Leucine-rich repeat (LRR) protein
MDCIYTILKFLPLKDIIKCSTISKLFNLGYKHPLLWKYLLIINFKNTSIPIHNSHTSFIYIYGLSKLGRYTKYYSSVDHLHKHIELDIYKKNMPTIKPQIFTLTHLKHLFITYSNLTIIPPQISNLINLKKLSFSNNKLTTLPIQLFSLTNLTTLYISKNKINSIPPEISNLVNLNELYAGDNLLTTVPEEITKLKDLTQLYLNANKIKPIPSYINRNHMPYLKILDLHNNH